jgi:hypothetical protein
VKDIITIVAGIPRCGSSLVMRMLYMGGYDVVANLGRMSFEDSRAGQPPELAPALLDEACGRAVKVLDLHRFELPATHRYQFIVLRRDPIEQAKSQAKFLRLLAGVDVNREHRQRLCAAIKVDQKRVEQLAARNGRTLVVSFEQLLAKPEEQALEIARHVVWQRGLALGVKQMAACVVTRPATCLPGLLEAAMVDAQRQFQVWE